MSAIKSIRRKYNFKNSLIKPDKEFSDLNKDKQRPKSSIKMNPLFFNNLNRQNPNNYLNHKIITKINNINKLKKYNFKIPNVKLSSVPNNGVSTKLEGRDRTKLYDYQNNLGPTQKEDKKTFLNNNNNDNKIEDKEGKVRNKIKVIIIHKNNANSNNNNLKVNIQNNNNIRNNIQSNNYLNNINIGDNSNKFNINNNSNNKNIINSKEFKQVEKEKEKENEINSENYLCFKCKEKASIEFKPFTLSLCMKCEKGHIIQNISMKEFKHKIELNKKIEFCSKCGNKNININDLYYCSCLKHFCQNCIKEQRHIKHSQIKFSKKLYYCLKHFKEYKIFCDKCNINICNDCLGDHNNHDKSLLYFNKILPNNIDIRKVKNIYEKMEQIKNIVNKNSDEIFENLKNNYIFNIEENMNLINNIISKIENKYYINYEDITNFNNIKLIEKKINFILNNLNNLNKNKQSEFLINLLKRFKRKS